MRWASEQQLCTGTRARGRVQARPWTYIGILLLLSASGAARADGAIDAWASWALAPKVWKGQTVLAPEPMQRPELPLVSLDSNGWPLRVHVPPRATRAPSILFAFEHAYDALHALSWPVPSTDGGRGGSAGIDLYVVPRRNCDAACSGVDASAPLSDFDAAETFALISDDLPDAELEPCAQSALAQAGLNAVDPAEAASWVRASAELSVWLSAGRLGCAGSFSRGQATPERGLLNADPSSGDAGALLLGMLIERLDSGQGAPGELLRNLWETTRQRSKGLVPADRLRSSPDLWEALQKTLETQHLALENELIEFGVARYFAGPAERGRQAPYRLFAALPSDAGVPVTRALTSFPAHVRDAPELASLGSAYYRVLLPNPPRSHELQVWLHGEQGPRWSLTAVRLDQSGRELGRMAAPARSVPSSYLSLVLDDETSEVVLVVAPLPRTTPDADRRNNEQHAYELIVSLPE